MSHDSLSRLPLISVTALALLVSACAPPPPPAPPKPEAQEARPTLASLGRTLNMVDKEGRVYGTVELDPLGGGKIIDSDGRVVGTIVPPTR